MTSSNRVGSDFNWINSLGANCSRNLRRREERETEAENPPSGANKVESIYWHIEQNAEKHNTTKYDLVNDQNPKPVLRRGETFYVTIRFTENFDLEKDRVVLNFCFGHKPSIPKGTLGVAAVKSDKFTFPNGLGLWDCRIDSGTQGKDLMLQVNIPANACVGIYHLEVLSGLQSAPKQPMNRYRDETECYVLFNPWCRDDAVYLDDNEKKEEYVLNDHGTVYKGSHKSPKGIPWVFGQFEDVVLPVAVYLLELSDVADPERGNPVKVVRGISAAVNSNNDCGVLAGRWGSRGYSDGVAPWEWKSSVRILEQYVKSGYQPVKYGQCWVFSALVTTVCRALGIPCRSVTNFVSAHDTDTSLTIDKFFDKQGDQLKGKTQDSVWNFHTWNDVWMARNDLPAGYGGWQAIDSTPQKDSDNKKPCGPVSLVAVRRGDIGLSYDTPFVFTEVNADIMHWVEDPQSEQGWSRKKTLKYRVGREIITKRVGKDDDAGNNDSESVVDDYKNKKGTNEERLAILSAIRGSALARQYYNFKDDGEDVAFDLIDIDKIVIGQPFQVKLVARNDSNEYRTVMAFLRVNSLYYTGNIASHIKKAEGNFVLLPRSKQEVTMTVKYAEYWPKLVEQCMMKMYTFCRIKETGQTFTDEDDFDVEKPRLDIQLTNEEVRVRTMCEATFSFTNPLDVPLTDCHLSVDGAGLMRPKANAIKEDVAPGAKFSSTMKFSPRIHGQRKIIATFNAKELFDISGSKTIKVLK